MRDPLDPQAWVARAEEDYVLARSALRRKVPLTYGATFHAQRCAEKYLKTLLVAQSLRFPRTHDLAAFSDICLRNGIDIKVCADLIRGPLSAIAWDLRRHEKSARWQRRQRIMRKLTGWEEWKVAQRLYRLQQYLNRGGAVWKNSSS